MDAREEREEARTRGGEATHRGERRRDDGGAAHFTKSERRLCTRTQVGQEIGELVLVVDRGGLRENARRKTAEREGDSGG